MLGSLAECTPVRYWFSRRTGLCAGDSGVRASGLCRSWLGDCVVEIDGVGFEYVGVVGCGRVYVLVDLAGIERCVVVVTDSEGNDVGGWRL